MCSRHQPEEGADSRDWAVEDGEQVTVPQSPMGLSSPYPVWPKRAVNGGWDRPTRDQPTEVRRDDFPMAAILDEEAAR